VRIDAIRRFLTLLDARATRLYSDATLTLLGRYSDAVQVYKTETEAGEHCTFIYRQRTYREN
jgi:hypothetical protein